MLDIIAKVRREEALASGSQTADFTGSSIDLKEVGSKGLQIYRDGAVTYDASNYFKWGVEHSDDNSNWEAAEYAEVDLEGAELQADGDVVLVQYEGAKRYMRLAATAVGSPEITVRADAILEKRFKPNG